MNEKEANICKTCKEPKKVMKESIIGGSKPIRAGTLQNKASNANGSGAVR